MPLEESLARVLTDIPNEDRGYEGISMLIRNLIFGSNPPAHTVKRPIVARQFSPQFAETIRSVALALVNSLLRELCGKEVNLGTDFSLNLATRFWGHVFELTPREIESIREAVHDIAPFLSFDVTSQELISVDRAMIKYLDVLGGAVERAKATGTNGLVNSMESRFLALDRSSRADGFGRFVAANIFDGFHTVGTAVTNVLYQLLSLDGALKAVRDAPPLVAGAVNEGLRLFPPLLFTQRFALEEFLYDGILIRKGSAIDMLWAAGNRDPEVFLDPEEYRLDRNSRAEATFGGGIHICPGRHVARLLSRAAVETIAGAAVEIEITSGDSAWMPRSSARQLDKLTVTIGGLQSP